MIASFAARSEHVFAAIDIDGLPRHEVGVGWRQKEDGADQIFTLLVALDRARLDLRRYHFGRHRPGDGWRDREAGRDYVDGDAIVTDHAARRNEPNSQLLRKPWIGISP
jgi:hypothetical protein